MVTVSCFQNVPLTDQCPSSASRYSSSQNIRIVLKCTFGMELGFFFATHIFLSDPAASLARRPSPSHILNIINECTTGTLHLPSSRFAITLHTLCYQNKSQSNF
ncbi:hypothetical protein TNIN_401571 [Trichonephila inaurata madagascariensis]|uniref:Uncharacterized protein n=1 Tax=Trichonephila inaurata madagascariensis TaxID=2747483 RepID=A0A8X6YTM2_9ARAC|nr:hypothetical protein TNIN_401571 [Trichonephila inaurata madagascariensis]